MSSFSYMLHATPAYGMHHTAISKANGWNGTMRVLSVQLAVCVRDRGAEMASPFERMHVAG